MIPAQSPLPDSAADALPRQPGKSDAVPHITGVNADQALPRFAGNQARYTHWLIEFVGHGPAAVAQIRQAILNGSLETAISLTHALKGRTGMLGMNELECIAMSLERALRNREPAAFWLEELEQTVGETTKQIDEKLGKQPV